MSVVDRRHFCLSSAAAMAFAAGGASLRSAHGASASASAGGPAQALYTVVYDSRFALSRAYGEAARAGGSVTAIRGDVTRLWLHDLKDRWAREHAPVGGMTTPSSLFCLEQLAKDQWMRVISRTLQSDAAGEQLVSWIIA